LKRVLHKRGGKKGVTKGTLSPFPTWATNGGQDIAKGGRVHHRRAGTNERGEYPGWPPQKKTVEGVRERKKKFWWRKIN